MGELALIGSGLPPRAGPKDSKKHIRISSTDQPHASVITKTSGCYARTCPMSVPPPPSPRPVPRSYSPVNRLSAETSLLSHAIRLFKKARGLGVFVTLSISSLRRLVPTPASNRTRVVAKREEQARLRELLTSRVQEVAEIFGHLSRVFVVNDKEAETEPDFYSLLDQVVQLNCRDCSGYLSCWQQNFYHSYRELFDLIALAEMNGTAQPGHLRGRLANSCIQRYRLLEAVDLILSRVQTSQIQRQLGPERSSFVADQLEGAASIMSGLASEVRLDMEFRLEVEERLKIAFNRLGLPITSLCVIDYGQDLLEVRVKKHGCLNYMECQYVMTPLVSRLLGHAYKIWEKECPRDSQQECCFSLVPAGCYRVCHAVGKIAKDPETSGDSHAIIHTKDGKHTIILSDGMGTGIKAARESQATVDLMGRLLAAGLHEEYALNLINTVLKLRSPEERFTTIDVGMIDLFHGQLEMIKIGAAPTYIKRGRKVIPIRAATPPAGILEHIEIDRQKLPLESDDYIIMVSDGLFSGELGPEETADWLEKALARVELAGPQPMVDFLLKIALTNMGSEIKDDVTVVVTQIISAAI